MMTTPIKLKFLVCTDVHLGFKHTDSVRGNDTFRTFEEILETAQKQKVDCILNAGDLFHNAKPDNQTMTKTAALLRKYCRGQPDTATYKTPPHDEHVLQCLQQLSLPMFTIHGNHDEPSGMGYKSPLHVMSEANLLCYIGTPSGGGDTSKRHVQPILIQKGAIQVALYAFGNVRDEKALAEAIKAKTWTFEPPPNPRTTYSVLMLHQNNSAKPWTRDHSLDHRDLPDYLDLIIWGHEHEPLRPRKQTHPRAMIYQPGSSVATSICKMEQKAKSVGIITLEGDGTTRRMNRITLQSVRPVLFDTSVSHMDEAVALKIAQKTLTWGMWLENHLKKQLSPPPNMLPLVRVLIDTAYLPDETRYQLNRKEVAQRLASCVANVNTVIRFMRRALPPVLVKEEDGGEPCTPAHNNVEENGNLLRQKSLVNLNQAQDRLDALVNEELARREVKFSFFDRDALHTLFRQVDEPSEIQSELIQLVQSKLKAK